MKYSFCCMLCLSFIIFNSCKNDSSSSNDPSSNERIDLSQDLEDYYQSYLKLNPVDATFAGITDYNDTWENSIAQENRNSTKAFYKSIIDKLDNIDRDNLSKEDQLSYDILKWDCTVAYENFAYPKYLTPIDQMWSPNLMVGQLASGVGAQPFETVEDYENWLLRVEGYLAWVETAMENMKEGMSKGIVLPSPLIKKVIPQFTELAKGKIEDHLFYSPVKNIPDSFSAEEEDKIKNEYTAMVEQKIIPTYQKMAKFLSNDYKGRDSDGIGVYGNGDEWYQHQIKTYTTTNMSADEIHELGLKEVARIRSEMEKVKDQIGFQGDLKSFFNHVRTNKELMPFKSPKEVIDNFNAIHDKMLPQLNKLFDLKPKTPFEVRQTEAFREASASAEYNQGSLDGTRPGIFYVPIPDVEKYNTYSDEDLFLHEAIPGHHYQISLQQENTSLPSFRKTLWYSAYGEGWALYTESLGKELGLYQDPYQYFGMLGAEIHRAIRLVVDTGIHSKGWSREMAIQYSLDNEAESEASIISEIERYMANPGQALSYKIGQLKIQELRKRASDKLGDKFDIKQFHNIVLESGCVPLAILEARIEEWIS